MESITYLIGNGFDINLGLKTKYTDFYGEYIASVKDLDDNDCRKRFAMKIDGNYENWADFEAGFAENITGGKDAVIKILSDFNEKFASYLMSETYKCNYKSPDIHKEFDKFLYGWIDLLEIKDKRRIYPTFQNLTPKGAYVNFINFNYTNVLQNLLGSQRKMGRVLAEINTNVYLYLDKHIQIHGRMHDNIIIGINSLEQILDEDTKRDISVEKYCVKRKINEALGFSVEEESFIQLIKSSSIIISYGLSFGKTDLCRWEIVSEWIRENEYHFLVVFKYSINFNNYPRSYLQLLLDAIDQAKDQMLALLGFKEDEYEKYRSQIFVIDSSKVLNFKLVQEPTAEDNNVDETDLIKE